MTMTDEQEHNMLDLGEVTHQVHLMRVCRQDYAQVFHREGRILSTFDIRPWPNPTDGDERKLGELDRDEASLEMDWLYQALHFEGLMLLNAESAVDVWGIVESALQSGYDPKKDGLHPFGPWLFHRIGTHLAARKVGGFEA